MNRDLGLDSSSGPDITMALGGKQAAHLILLFTALTSSDMLVSTGHEAVCLSLCPITHHVFAHHNSVLAVPDRLFSPCCLQQAALAGCMSLFLPFNGAVKSRVSGNSQ